MARASSPNGRLPSRIAERLRLPAIAAPMLNVSGVELVAAATRSGIIGAFPCANAGDQLERWLTELLAAGDTAAPVCPNLIMRHPRVDEHLEILVRHRVEMVITSVGSPARAVGPLHDIGCLVFADVATVAHARKALAAGADGLVLLTAGAGGQTGWLNPLAFVRAVRHEFDGPLVLAGGIADGRALRAVEVLGCDLGYLGTQLIATHESMADDGYKDMLVSSEMDDIVLTRAFTGLPTSVLRASIVNAGLDPDDLDESITAEAARSLYGPHGAGPRRWTAIASAGHSVSSVRERRSVSAVVDALTADYSAAASPPCERAQAPESAPRR